MSKASRIAKVQALYERAGTTGEKQAARAALKRLGVTVKDDFVTEVPEDFDPEEFVVKLNEMVKLLSLHFTNISESVAEFVRQMDWVLEGVVDEESKGID